MGENSKLKVLVVTCIALSLYGDAFAKNGFSGVTGKDLQEWCHASGKVNQGESDSVSDIMLSGRCAAYIIAVNDTLFLSAGMASGVIQNKNAKISMAYCLPDGILTGQYIQAVTEYLNNNPKALEVRAPIAVYGAFVKNYPCK